MSDQLQCPNCGGFKTNDKVIHLDSTTRTPIQSMGSCGCLFVSFLFLGGLVQILGPWASSSKQNGEIANAVLIGTVVLLVVIYILSRHTINQRRALALKRHELECNLCGKQWRWDEGDPYPAVTVQPDLIAKGDERLRRIAEERRLAEGAFYLNQQRHKK